MVPSVATGLPLSSTRSRVTLLLIKPRKGVYGTWDVTVISVFSPEKNPRGSARGGAGAKSPPTGHALGAALAVGVDIGAPIIGALATAPSSAMAAAGIFSVLTILGPADDAVATDIGLFAKDLQRTLSTSSSSLLRVSCESFEISCAM